jgi:agmatine deiminase
MPAEWEPHSQCWMAWPCREELWGDRLDAARRATADVAKAISDFEPVTMIARPELTASVSLYCGQGVTVLPMPQDDSWSRDTGPTFLVADAATETADNPEAAEAEGASNAPENRPDPGAEPGTGDAAPDGADPVGAGDAADAGARLAAVAWQFNGWGEVYEDYAQDAQMARRLLDHLGIPRYQGPLVLEGGSIHVDGEGTCLVCEGSVLDPKRNPGRTREEVEAVLRDHLSVERVIWLPFGLVDDETRGHIDNVACFARPGVVLVHSTDDEKDANYEGIQRNLEVLGAARDARGRDLEIIKLPQPKAQMRGDGRRLTLSYINFYLPNGGLIMPAFNDNADTPAYKALTAAFPDRRIVQIDAVDLIHGGGGIHCITQQQPAVPGAGT